MERRNGFSSVSGSSIQKFDGKNYKDWAFEMELLLTQERAWSIVSGEEKAPPGPVDEVKEEVDEDGKVIVPGKPAVDASNKYNDYLWRYHAAVRLIFMALERGLARQYMTIRDPVELWKAIKHDHIGELQKSHIWVKRDLYEVKLKDHGSIKAYAMRIQELIDQYAAGAKEDTDRIPKKDHVFFLLNGIPQTDEWDVELRLLTDQLGVLGEDPRAVINKLSDREDKIKSARGLTSEVALYTKSGDMASGKNTGPGKKSDKKEKQKVPAGHGGDQEKTRTCYICKKSGHVKKDCPEKGRKVAGPNDKKETSNTANVATSSTAVTTDTLWMTLADPGPGVFLNSVAGDADQVYKSSTEIDASRDVFLDSACTRHVINRKDLFVTYLPLKEGVSEVKGFNQSRAYAKGVGDVRLPMRVPDGIRWIKLQNVLHVEESANLVSQGRLIRRGLHLEINGYGVNVYTPNGELTACAPLVGLMLPFDVAWDALEESGKETANNSIVHSFKTTAREVGGAELKLWHRRYAHLGLEALKRLPEAVTGMDASLGGACDCEACVKGKHARSPFHPASKRATARLDLVHADICGPFPESLSGKGRYMLLFIDDATRFTWCFILERKSEAEARFREWKAEMLTQYDLKAKRFRTDGGGEFTSKRFLQYLRQQGIAKETTAPYSPQSNGVAERANRTIVERVRSMLEDARLSKRYWAEACMTAVYVKNLSPTRALDRKLGATPYEAFHGKKPDVKHLRVFGCLAFVHVPAEKRLKLDLKSKACIFLGYSLTTKAYRLYDPVDGRLIVSRDVIFRENARYSASILERIDLAEHFMPVNVSPRKYYFDDDSDHDVQAPGSSSTQSVIVDAPSEQEVERQLLHEVDADLEDYQHLPLPEKPEKKKRMVLELAPTAGGKAFHQDINLNAPRVTRSRVDRAQLVIEAEDGNDCMPAVLAYITLDDSIPKSYKSVLTSPDRERWETAMVEELDAIDKHEVYEEIEQLPKGRKMLGSDWVLALKKNAAGEVLRYKARVVARGDLQRKGVPGVDFGETYAPTARMSHVRLTLAYAAKYGLDVYQMDVRTAFLGSVLHEEVYMRPPPGWEHLRGKGERGPGTSRCVWKLVKSLYGLKQSPYEWYHTLRIFLLELGFTISRVDGGFFIMVKEDSTTLILSVYVDDMLMVGSRNLIEELKKQLTLRFDMHDLGQASFYLGMQIEFDGDYVYLSQQAYLEKVLERFGMKDVKPIGTPMDPKDYKKTMVRRELSGEEACDKTLYQSKLGSVMYLMTSTRPDICFTVGVLSRFSSDPSVGHMRGMDRLLRYLAGSKHLRLQLGGKDADFEAYADADYASSRDDYRSTSGYVMMYGRGAIDWRSKKQKSTAQSTTDAEYYAFGVACMRMLSLDHLYKELRGHWQLEDGVKPRIYGDNESMVTSLRNRIYRGTEVAHIATKFYLAADLVQEGYVDLVQVPTAEMLADGFTKPFALPAHRSFCTRLGLV
jgi:transposase InsO family protein